ncbi:hypothetical protein ABZP36_008495 [Zizania latifolia]
MERSEGVGDDSTRGAVSICDRFLTFLAKNLSMNRQKSITEGPRNGGNDHGSHAEEGEEVGEDDDDEFTIKIEKAEFEFIHEEEDRKSVTATVLEEIRNDNTDVMSTAGASVQEEEGAGQHPVAAEAAPEPVVQENTKLKRTVTVKEDKDDAGASSTAKKSLFKKRQASSSQLGGDDQQKPARRVLRPRMPSILRVPSNINEKSATFIEERKKSFGAAGGKPEK